MFTGPSHTHPPTEVRGFHNIFIIGRNLCVYLVRPSLGVKFDPICVCGFGIEVLYQWYRFIDVRIDVSSTDLILTKCLLQQTWAVRFYLIDIQNFMRGM
jgi:hypothetical protein